jgi:hypothetical protein
LPKAILGVSFTDEIEVAKGVQTAARPRWSPTFDHSSGRGSVLDFLIGHLVYIDLSWPVDVSLFELVSSEA